MDFSYIYLSKHRKKGKHKRGYKIVNRKRWRFIIIDMRHLLLWKEVRRKEKRKEKREKGKRERVKVKVKVRVRRSAATELLQTQPLGYLILHSSFFTLHLFSSLFVLLFLLLLLLSQILRELKSCHIEELVERRYRFHQA